MNKLTKLLSVFVIAGALGVGMAGGAVGCKGNGGGDDGGDKGVHHTDSHELKYESKNDQKHTITCKVPGCDFEATEGDHTYDGDEDATCNNGCGYVREIGGGVDDNYDLVTTSVDFREAIEAVSPGATGDVTLTAPYTYKNKITFAAPGKARFEYSNKAYNTQGASGTVTIELTGETNSIKIVGTSGSGKFTGAELKCGSEVIATTGESFGTIQQDNLPKGTYVLTTNGGAGRITEITIVEKLEKSDATGITVTPLNVDFLKGEELKTNDITVKLHYKNGRTDALFNTDYSVTSNYDKNNAGKYTVTVTYGKNANFTDTYDVYVYTIDSIEVHTIGLTSDGKTQLTLQQAAKTGGAISSDNLTVKGTGTVGEGTTARTHTFNLPAAALNVELPSTATAGEQTANISVNTEYTTNGASLTDSYKVMVKDAITAENNKVEITVGATGDFKTLTQAVQYLKQCDLGDGVTKIIKLQAGTYTEKVWIDVPNVTLIGLGENIDDTKITYSLVEGDKDAICGGSWGLTCATVHVKAAGFKAYNLNIRNDFDYITNSGKYSGSQAAQGVALTINGDGAVVSNCHLYGNQDTLYIEDGRSYFYKTQVDGNVDFIFGGEKGLAYFEECKIVAINRTAVNSETGKGNAQNGYVTAAKHDTKTKPDYGYVFYKCEMTDDGKVADGAMSLGRSWGTNATVAYIECSFSKAYSVYASDYTGEDGKNKDHRWADWSNGTKAENADFKEYGSTGEGAITTAVKGGDVIDKATADLHTKANMFGTSNGQIGYTSVFDCDAALLKLHSYASGEELEEYTVTINDIAGNPIGTKKYTQGETIRIAELKEYINNLDSVKNDDKEVDKIYMAYTDETTNEELTADCEISADGDIYVSLKAKNHSVALTDSYTFNTGAAASNSNFTQTVAKGDTVTYGKLTIYGGTDGGDNFFQDNGGTYYRIKGDAYVQFTVDSAIRLNVGSYSGGLKLVKVDGETETTISDVDGNTTPVLFDINEAGTYRLMNVSATGGQQYISSINFAAVPEKDVTVTVYNTDGETPTAVGESWQMSSQDLVHAGKLETLKASLTAPEGKEFDDYYTDADCTTKFNPKTDKLAAGEKGIYIGWKVVKSGIDQITEAKGFSFGKSSGIAGEADLKSQTVTNGSTKILADCLEVTAAGKDFSSNGGDWFNVGANTTIKLKVKAGLKVDFLLYNNSDTYGTSLDLNDFRFEIYIGETKQAIAPTGSKGQYVLTVDAQETDVEITLKCTTSDYIGYIKVS